MLQDSSFFKTNSNNSSFPSRPQQRSLDQGLRVTRVQFQSSLWPRRARNKRRLIEEHLRFEVSLPSFSLSLSLLPSASDSRCGIEMVRRHANCRSRIQLGNFPTTKICAKNCNKLASLERGFGNCINAKRMPLYSRKTNGKTILCFKGKDGAKNCSG